MKILKLLNKKKFLIILFLFFGLIVNAEEQPVDIWNVDQIKELDINQSSSETINQEDDDIQIEPGTNIYQMQSQNKKIQ